MEESNSYKYGIKSTLAQVIFLIYSNIALEVSDLKKIVDRYHVMN